MRAAIEEFKIETAKENPSGNKNYDAIFESLKRQVTEVKNSEFASFNEKFYFTMNETKSVIKEIIGFSVEDFNRLKKMRNLIAHGDKPLTESDSDITFEMGLRCKLKLLLIYWAFQDFGFTDEDFVRFLSIGLHPIIREANLNTHVIDKVLNRYFYLKMTEYDFNLVREKRHLCVVLSYVEASDTYNMELDATRILDEWFRRLGTAKHRTVEEELMSTVDVSTVKNIGYLGTAYVCFGESEHKIESGICILNCPDVISNDESVKNRLHIYDDVNKQWLPSKFERQLKRSTTTN